MTIHLRKPPHAQFHILLLHLNLSERATVETRPKHTAKLPQAISHARRHRHGPQMNSPTLYATTPADRSSTLSSTSPRPLVFVSAVAIAGILGMLAFPKKGALHAAEVIIGSVGPWQPRPALLTVGIRPWPVPPMLAAAHEQSAFFVLPWAPGRV